MQMIKYQINLNYFSCHYINGIERKRDEKLTGKSHCGDNTRHIYI